LTSTLYYDIINVINATHEHLKTLLESVREDLDFAEQKLAYLKTRIAELATSKIPAAQLEMNRQSFLHDQLQEAISQVKRERN